MEYNSDSNSVSNFKIWWAWDQFEIRITITPWIVRHEVELLINHIDNKFRELKMSSKNFFWTKTL